MERLIFQYKEAELKHQFQYYFQIIFFSYMKIEI